jgi:hypothetical protein
MAETITRKARKGRPKDRQPAGTKEGNDQSQVFENPWTTSGFHKELAMNYQFMAGNLSFEIFEYHGYIYKLCLWFFEAQGYEYTEAPW